MMYGGFTDNAQNALNTAQQFAQANGFNYVGTEHILYGIGLRRAAPQAKR